MTGSGTTNADIAFTKRSCQCFQLCMPMQPRRDRCAYSEKRLWSPVVHRRLGRRLLKLLLMKGHGWLPAITINKIGKLWWMPFRRQVVRQPVSRRIRQRLVEQGRRCAHVATAVLGPLACLVTIARISAFAATAQAGQATCAAACAAANATTLKGSFYLTAAAAVALNGCARCGQDQQQHDSGCAP